MSDAALSATVRRRLLDGDGDGLPLRRRIAKIAAEEACAGPAEMGRLVDELAASLAGLGVLEPLLADPGVAEIMVNGPDAVFVERDGRLERTDIRFPSEESVRRLIERVTGPLGLRVDESSPMVDARLPDGSRFNAVIPPLARCGPCCNIRRFVLRQLSFDDLVRRGSLSAGQAAFLGRAVRERRSILVSGATSSGKTTFLNVLSSAISGHERLITIEDSAELRLVQPHVVSLEARPAGVEGTGAVTLRDLVRNALRMRPDRIIVGEVRGPEAIDMLAAMNTGHDGSLSTLHASSPADALARLEVMLMMGEFGLPLGALRRQIASAIDVVVQLERTAGGVRRVAAIARVGDASEGGIDILDVGGALSQGSTP